eukprot:PhM_4_TR3025/c0_g1_i2/m.46492
MSTRGGRRRSRWDQYQATLTAPTMTKTRLNIIGTELSSTHVLTLNVLRTSTLPVASGAFVPSSPGESVGSGATVPCGMIVMGANDGPFGVPLPDVDVGGVVAPSTGGVTVTVTLCVAVASTAALRVAVRGRRWGTIVALRVRTLSLGCRCMTVRVASEVWDSVESTVTVTGDVTEGTGITMPLVDSVVVAPLNDRVGSSESVGVPMVRESVRVRDCVVVFEGSVLNDDVSEGDLPWVRERDGVTVWGNVFVRVSFGVAVRGGERVHEVVRVGGSVRVPLRLWVRESVGEGDVRLHVGDAVGDNVSAGDLVIDELGVCVPD